MLLIQLLNSIIVKRNPFSKFFYSYRNKEIYFGPKSPRPRYFSKNLSSNFIFSTEESKIFRMKGYSKICLRVLVTEAKVYEIMADFDTFQSNN